MSAPDRDSAEAVADHLHAAFARRSAGARDWIVEKVADLAGCGFADVPDDATWDGLGLDSLDRVELQVATESWLGVDITDDEFAAAVTIADLVTLVDAKRSAAA